MKIVIAASDGQVSAQIDSRFGRAPYFAIVETENDDVQFIENENAQSPSGAGVAVGQKIVELGAQIVVAGNCGPKAEQILAAAGVKIRTDITGAVEDVIKLAKENKL